MTGGNLFSLIANVVLVALGLQLLLIGGAGLLGWDETWMLWAVMAGAGGLLAYGGASSFVASWGLLKRAREREAGLASGEGAVLAVWPIPDATGRIHQRKSAAEHALSALAWLGVITLGGGMAVTAAGAGPLLGFPFALLFGCCVVALRFALHLRRLRAVKEVRISRSMVMFDGRPVALSDGVRHVADVRIEEDAGQSALLIEIAWTTRRGPMSETVRVPVPPDRHEEADAVALALMEGPADA